MNKHDDRKSLLRHVKYSRNRCSKPLKHTSKSVFPNASYSLPTATKRKNALAKGIVATVVVVVILDMS